MRRERLKRRGSEVEVEEAEVFCQGGEIRG